MITLFYIHGMGGGETSRIPNLLRKIFEEQGLPIRVVCPTYDFDPEVAHPFLADAIRDCKPDLIIGESLGSIHALRFVAEAPLLLVSPSLGAPALLCRLAPWTFIPGVSLICRHIIWRVKYPGRQTLRFRYRILKHYKAHNDAMLSAVRGKHSLHAFFGDYDHYKRSGVVDTGLWDRYFGAETRTPYPGTHFMEEEYVRSMLVPAILQRLKLQ